MRNIRKPKPLRRRSVKQKHPAILKKLAIGFVIAVFAALVYMAIANKTDEAQQRIELQKTIQELQTTKANFEKVHTSSQAEKAKQDQLINELNKQLEEKEKALQAKRQANTAYAATPTVRPTGGTCEQWMTQAGIPLSSAALQLIKNESGCNPGAVNPSSGACGIPQALPCSKLPCSLSDPVCQLRWMDAYVKERYNNWEGALSFWHCTGTCYNNYGPTVKTGTWY